MVFKYLQAQGGDQHIVPPPSASCSWKRGQELLAHALLVHSPILKSSPARLVCQVHQTNILASFLPCPALSEQLRSRVTLGIPEGSYLVPAGSKPRHSSVTAGTGCVSGHPCSY